MTENPSKNGSLRRSSAMNKESEEIRMSTETESTLQFTIGDDGETIENFTKKSLVSIVEATKAVNALPSGASRDLYCAYPTYGKIIESQSDRILNIISKVLKRQNIKGNIQRRQKDEQFELVLECNDVMLERVNSNLDDLAGVKKNPQTVLVESQVSFNVGALNKGAESWNISLNKTPSQQNQTRTARLITAKNIQRPQVSFKVPVDNRALMPFEPRIKEKPNSLKPLAILPEYDDDGCIESYLHPYEFELNKFEPPKSQLKTGKVTEPNPIETTPLIYIEEEDKLQELLEDLRKEKEIAIDLEHHSYRTFQGFTCLMQISTRHKDYIIDTIKLRDELHILNEVFTNPKIVKIFHGADRDIEWLQRDLSLYIVNMFDTHQAAKLLSFPRLSLSYIMKHYCNLEPDKTFQLADWRIRPLPDELILYARQDTHYLIYIYEKLRNELLAQGKGESNLLETAYQKSTEICQRRYVKPRIYPDSHLELYRKSKRIFDNRQLYALKELFLWRDKIARQEDESIGYVLPNHMMLQIAESLPREMQGILACCNPIPPLIKQNLHHLHQMILKAREQPLVKPIINEEIENRVIISTTKDYNNKLYCRQDLSHNTEFRDDLPTLLGPIKEKKNTMEEEIIFAKPMIDIFEKVQVEKGGNSREKLLELKDFKFITPYERYKAVLPFAEKKRREEAAAEEERQKAKQLCPVKQEPQATNSAQPEDDPYKLPPVRESLKREHDLEDGDIEEPKSKRRKGSNNPETSSNSKNVNGDSQENVQSASSSNSFLSLTNSTVSVREETGTTEESDSTKSSKDILRKVKDKKRFKPNKKNKSAQDSNQPVNFDFSQVDYRKFEGGAQSIKGQKIEGKFHGKGKNNKVNNKKFNKLFTFSSSNKKK